MCGEFLSIETQTQLQRLGVDPSALGAVPIEQVAMYSSCLSMTSALPFRALSLSRFRLDDAMLGRAQNRRKFETQRGSEVGELDSAGWNVLCETARRSTAALVLATGKLGLRGVDDARDRSLVGLKMHLRLCPKPAARSRAR